MASYTLIKSKNLLEQDLYFMLNLYVKQHKPTTLHYGGGQCRDAHGGTN
jgi:hypothetical protein